MHMEWKAVKCMNQNSELSFDMSNRRVAKRHPINLPVSFSGNEGMSINISETGMRFATLAPVTAGSFAKVSVWFEKETVELVAETIWATPQGPGSVVGAVFKRGSQLARLSRNLPS